MYNFKLKPFFSPEVPEARANKTGLNLMIVHFYISGKLDIIRCYTYFFSMAENRLNSSGSKPDQNRTVDS